MPPPRSNGIKPNSLAQHAKALQSQFMTSPAHVHRFPRAPLPFRQTVLVTLSPIPSRVPISVGLLSLLKIQPTFSLVLRVSPTHHPFNKCSLVLVCVYQRMWLWEGTQENQKDCPTQKKGMVLSKGVFKIWERTRDSRKWNQGWETNPSRDQNSVKKTVSNANVFLVTFQK